MAIDIETTGIHWTESQPAITCQRVETERFQEINWICVWNGLGVVVGSIHIPTNCIFLESIRNAIK